MMSQTVVSLLSQVEAECGRLKAQARYQRKISFGFRIVAAVMTVATTILLGLDFGSPDYLVISRNAALIFTSIGAGLATLESFWDVHGYWFRLKLMAHEMDMLRNELQLLPTESDASADTTKYVTQYLSILDRRGDVWRQAMQKPPSAEPRERPAGDSGK